MKKTILAVAITGMAVAASLTAFGQENKKAVKARKEIKSAQKDLKEAKMDLREAKMDSLADYEKFRKEAEINISENQKSIADLKAKKSSDNKETKEKYDKKVLALEQKNTALKKKIDGSATTKTSMWTSFKREFNHDMSELGHAIKDIGVDNAK